jgi:7TM-HD extracellular
VGERAKVDVVTPIPLVVFQPARTESLRQIEAQKTPPVFRHYAVAMREAEEALKHAFAETRSRFASGLEEIFNHPLPLLAAELEQGQFGEWVSRFREQHSDFPLTAGLAELWALGDSGEVALNGLLAKLALITNSYVRADRLPPGERLNTGSIRFITVEETNASLTLADVDKHGHNLARTNLVALEKLRQDALKEIAPGEQATAKYVSGFIRPNLIYDLELTRQARARRVESINAADRYAAGQRLVAKGDVVNARTKLALDELRSRTAAERVQATAASERTSVEAQAVVARRAAEAARRTNRWLFAGLSAVVVVLGALITGGFLRRRALARASLDPSFAMVSLSDETAGDLAWRERALAAEARAQKATAMLRASLLPHLARWMMNELVQRLLSQRSEIMTGQQKAEREVAELAARLEEVHAPLEDRLRAYEQRIAELETELAAKGEQNLDLIKAKIETTRKQLEGERSQERLDWN